MVIPNALKSLTWWSSKNMYTAGVCFPNRVLCLRGWVPSCNKKEAVQIDDIIGQKQVMSLQITFCKKQGNCQLFNRIIIG